MFSLHSVLSGPSLLLGGLLLGSAQAQYKVDTRENIIASARTLAYDLMLQYDGNQTGMIPGILPGPPTEFKGNYYWWEGGAMMGTYIDYWKLTGDTSYNHVVMEGMLHQTGKNFDYQPSNHTLSLGNDDQGFWGMSAMLAAENKFPNPPDDQPQWLALAQAVWTTQANPTRHDSNCNGGMRWQIPFSNAGFNYKNTIANGIFFNMGARLARYTSNETYAKHAEETWDWLWAVEYIDHKSWLVYDGAHVDHNCTDIDKATYSYNAAVLTQGVAFMYNYTDGAEKWRDRLDNMLTSLLKNFFPKDIAYEVPCEGRQGACSTDMLSFKGYVHRWLAVTAQIAPAFKDKILPVLEKSAKAAAAQCTGGQSGRVCGFYWDSGQFVDPAIDKTSGAGEQMNVLAAVSSLLIESVEPPATNKTGGISKGDTEAGTHSRDGRYERELTMSDKAGAGILTFMLLSGALFTFIWMSFFD